MEKTKKKISPDEASILFAEMLKKTEIASDSESIESFIRAYYEEIECLSNCNESLEERYLQMKENSKQISDIENKILKHKKDMNNAYDNNARNDIKSIIDCLSEMYLDKKPLSLDEKILHDVDFYLNRIKENKSKKEGFILEKYNKELSELNSEKERIKNGIKELIDNLDEGKKEINRYEKNIIKYLTLINKKASKIINDYSELKNRTIKTRTKNNKKSNNRKNNK